VKRHHISVPRTARYVTLGEIDATVRELWFVLHGYGILAASFIQQFAVLDRSARLIVAPEGLSRYYTDHASGTVGASWMTREDRLAEIDDYVRYLDLVHDHVLQQVERVGLRVTVLGFSQGAAAAGRWVANGGVRVDRLLVWGGLLPPELRLDQLRNRLGNTELLYVVGERDRIVRYGAVKEQAGQAQEHGLRVTTVRFDGGHEIDAATLTSLAPLPPA
jgi:predicted esterase